MKKLRRLLLLAFYSLKLEAGVILIDSEAELAKHPKLDRLLNDFPPEALASIEPVDGSLIPEAKELSAKLAERVGSMLIPEEMALDVYVILSSSLNPNAFFLDLGEGARLISLSMGLVWLMGEEDKTVSVIGHELEHGWSKIAEIAKQKQDWTSILLRRVVENEVDIKSYFKRVRKIGGSAYGMKNALRTLREHHGDGFSDTHTSTASREDALDAAMTIARRELGEEDISLSTSAKLEGGITPLLLSSQVSRSDYEKRLVEQLRTRLASWIEAALKKELAKLSLPKDQSKFLVASPQNVFDWIWETAASYFDIAMEAQNYRTLRNALIREMYDVYFEQLSQNIRDGIEHRPEHEIRRLLALSVPFSQEEEISRQNSLLKSSEKRLRSAEAEYEKQQGELGEKADKTVSKL